MDLARAAAVDNIEARARTRTQAAKTAMWASGKVAVAQTRVATVVQASTTRILARPPALPAGIVNLGSIKAAPAGVHAATVNLAGIGAALVGAHATRVRAAARLRAARLLATQFPATPGSISLGAAGAYRPLSRWYVAGIC